MEPADERARNDERPQPFPLNPSRDRDECTGDRLNPPETFRHHDGAETCPQCRQPGSESKKQVLCLLTIAATAAAVNTTHGMLAASYPCRSKDWTPYLLVKVDVEDLHISGVASVLPANR